MIAQTIDRSAFVALLLRSVSLADEARDTVGSGRSGSVYATVEDTTTRLGAPTVQYGVNAVCFDDKVTVEWHFDTPRGPAVLHDFWWNHRGVLSLRGNPKAVQWLRFWLNHHNIKASTSPYRYHL